MLYLIGNWKSHQTITQAKEWFDQFASLKPIISPQVRVAISSSFTTLSEINRLSSHYRLEVESAAQDVSIYPEGKHTGEVTALMLSELTHYCLVGHSERRREFSEDCDQVAQKARLLLDHQITPLVCLDLPYLDEQIKSFHHHRLPLDSLILAYEPASAIGSGQAQDPTTVASIISQIMFLVGDQTPILYGGSVNPDNCTELVSRTGISGCLVGTASLDPNLFNQLLKQVTI